MDRSQGRANVLTVVRGLALVVAVVALAGCKDEGKPVATAPTSPPETVAVASPEWRAVIDDWYDNGVFDDTHTCGAVRKAISSVPKRDYSPPLEDFEAYAELVCDR